MELRITEVMQKILKEISKNPSYGYALSKKLKLDVNVVYQALHVLEKRKYISHKIKEGQGPDRKVYYITEKGEKLLELL